MNESSPGRLPQTVTYKQFVAMLGGGVVAAILLTIVLVNFTTIGVGTNAPKPAAVAGADAGPVNDGEPFTASGVIVQTDDSYKKCTLSGDEVVIMDAEGTDLGFGNLSSPKAKESREDDGTKFGNYSSTCTYSFEIPDIEAGHEIYKMTIAGQDAPRQTEQELRGGVSLTLG